MAGSVNKVILIGNVGKDPEIRTTQSGHKIGSLSIATSQSWKDKATGEKKENTQWHRIVIFNEAVVNIVEKFVKKGSKLFVEGQLETRKWVGEDGRDNYVTEVTIRPYHGGITLLEGKKPGVPENNNVEEPQEMSYDADIDEDIPF